MEGWNLDEERKEYNQDDEHEAPISKDDFFDDYSNSDINKKDNRENYQQQWKTDQETFGYEARGRGRGRGQRG